MPPSVDRERAAFAEPDPLVTGTSTFEPSAVLSTAFAGWMNQIVGPRGAWSGHLGARAFSVAPKTIGRTDAEPAGSLVDLVWKADGGEIVISVPRALLDELVASVQPGLPLPPEPTGSLLLEMALSDALAAIEAEAGILLCLDAVRGHRPGGGALVFEARFGDLRAPVYVALFDPRAKAVPRPYEILAGLIQRLPPQPVGPPGDIPFALIAQIGSLRIRAQLLGGVRPGDVLLPDECSLARNNVDLLIGGLATQADVAGSRLLVRGALKPRSDNPEIASMTTQDSSSDPWTLLDDVDIAVTFELGRWSMPLRDLKMLGEGYIFDLGRPAEGPVDILANGRRIGRGEIVRIGDTLGVRLLESLASDD
ncbi:type III secretion system cytoplasmic ring protein SctQ [Terrihabitans sp. B22-R8]|uniref:type III secretion system cytoplasmic ring protein SctQ n=1 Tax=Terrihabitans sp. B22-R8 TaxID=3425128 RepID=UPI00403CA572